MHPVGYLLFGVFLLGPVVGTAAATVRPRTRLLFLYPLWAATLGTVLYSLKLLTGQLNLPDSALAADFMMAFGGAAWVLLVPTLVFRKPTECGSDGSGGANKGRTTGGGSDASQ